MNVISLIAGITPPSDLWNNLINWLNGSIQNIGWTILILTILVKLVTSPLDFMVKYSTKKQTLLQQKCAPQIAKLQKKFGKDQQTLRIQTNALYKREGMNMGVSCFVMLFNLVLTCTIFFSFFSSLRTISAYQTINQYEQTVEAYQSSLTNYVKEEKNISLEEAELFIKDYNDAIKYINNTSNETEDPDYATNFENATNIFETNADFMTDAINASVSVTMDAWNKCKSNWLWVQNIWVADAPTNPFPTFDELKTTAANGGTYYSTYIDENIDYVTYNNVANIINSNTKSLNGFYILAILAAVTTYLSQLVSDLHNKLKNKKANTLANATSQQTAGSMKMMKIIMPIIMVMFVLTSSASFGIYLIASSIAGIAIGEIINLLVNKLTKKKREEVEAYLEKEATRLIKKGKLQE